MYAGACKHFQATRTVAHAHANAVHHVATVHSQMHAAIGKSEKDSHSSLKGKTLHDFVRSYCNKVKI